MIANLGENYEKYILILAIVCTLFVGCKAQQLSGAPTDAPTNTPTATDVPTNMPTATVAPTETPTPTEVPAIDKIITDLESFVGTIEHGNMVRKYKQLTENERISLFEICDRESELPWGTITGFSKVSEDGIGFKISNGYKFAKNLCKEGMTIDEFAKQIEGGTGYKIEWVPESDKPDGTILSVEEHEMTVVDGYSDTVIYVAGKERETEVLPPTEKLIGEYHEEDLNKTKLPVITLGTDYNNIPTDKKNVYDENNYVLREYGDAYGNGGDPYLYFDCEYNSDGKLIRKIKYYADNRVVIEEYTYLEKKCWNDIFGLWEKGTAKVRCDYYDATVGKTSDEKTPAGYSVIESFYSGASEYSDRDMEITNFGIFYSWEEISVYRADNTLQAIWSTDRSMRIGDASNYSYSFELYDKNGKNPKKYTCGHYDFNDMVLVDEYGFVTIIQ